MDGLSRSRSRLSPTGFFSFFRLLFYVSALIVDNGTGFQPQAVEPTIRRTNEWPQRRRRRGRYGVGGGADLGTDTGAGAGVCAGAVARAGEEQLTGCTAAKQTVDHVWRRLPVNARDNLAIGAGGDVDAPEEIGFYLSHALGEI